MQRCQNVLRASPRQLHDSWTVAGMLQCIIHDFQFECKCDPPKYIPLDRSEAGAENNCVMKSPKTMGRFKIENGFVNSPFSAGDQSVLGDIISLE